MAKPKQRSKTRTQYDFLLFTLTMIIAMFGVVMIYSASSYTGMVKMNNPYRFVMQQVLGLGVGAIAMLCVSFVDYHIFLRKIKRLKISLVHIVYVLAMVLQTLVLFIGVEKNGAKRWLRFGPLQFQPSEISKIAAILLVAYLVYQGRKQLDYFLGFLKIMLFVAPLIVLIALENLSTAIIITIVSAGMCFVASQKKLYFVLGFLCMLSAILAYIFLGAGFRADRIAIWLHVETNPKGFQILQGLYAIASGGIFGCGLGNSMQKLGYIPESYNDMIFSVICEELGLVGVIILLAVFLVMLWRILVIACHAPDLFGGMICMGVLLHIAVQVILNIAVVTNSIPSTGVPLPFVSYGGTSAAIMMAEMGLVLGTSSHNKNRREIF